MAKFKYDKQWKITYYIDVPENTTEKDIDEVITNTLYRVGWDVADTYDGEIVKCS